MGLCGLSVLIALVPLALDSVLRAHAGDRFTELVLHRRHAASRSANQAAEWRTPSSVRCSWSLSAPHSRSRSAILSGVYAAEYAGHQIRRGRPLLGGHAQRRSIDRHRGVRIWHRASCRSSNSRRWRAASRLGIMMIPLIMRTTEELLRLVPQSSRKARSLLARHARAPCSQS